MSYKPQDQSTVAPYLIVESPDQLIEFLQAVFSAKLLSVRRDEGGKVRHGELQIEDSTIMLSQATQDFPANPSMLHVYVSDARATYVLALQAGGSPIMEPQVNPNDPDDNDLRGGFFGPCGNQWWVGTKSD